ncbi:MAG: hypothetical protein ABII08_02535 [Candidatus Beckwithbacteria bacterium]
MNNESYTYSRPQSFIKKERWRIRKEGKVKFIPPNMLIVLWDLTNNVKPLDVSGTQRDIYLFDDINSSSIVLKVAKPSMLAATASNIREVIAFVRTSPSKGSSLHWEVAELGEEKSFLLAHRIKGPTLRADLEREKDKVKSVKLLQRAMDDFTTRMSLAHSKGVTYGDHNIGDNLRRDLEGGTYRCVDYSLSVINLLVEGGTVEAFNNKMRQLRQIIDEAVDKDIFDTILQVSRAIGITSTDGFQLQSVYDTKKSLGKSNSFANNIYRYEFKKTLNHFLDEASDKNTKSVLVREKLVNVAKLKKLKTEFDKLDKLSEISQWVVPPKMFDSKYREKIEEGIELLTGWVVGSEGGRRTNTDESIKKITEFLLPLLVPYELRDDQDKPMIDFEKSVNKYFFRSDKSDLDLNRLKGNMLDAIGSFKEIAELSKLDLVQTITDRKYQKEGLGDKLLRFKTTEDIKADLSKRLFKPFFDMSKVFMDSAIRDWRDLRNEITRQMAFCGNFQNEIREEVRGELKEVFADLSRKLGKIETKAKEVGDSRGLVKMDEDFIEWTLSCWEEVGVSFKDSVDKAADIMVEKLA